MWQDNLLVSLDPLTLSCAAESSIKTHLSLVLEGWLIQSGLLFGVYSVSCHSYWEDRSKSVPNRNLYTRIHSLIARSVFLIVSRVFFFFFKWDPGIPVGSLKSPSKQQVSLSVIHTLTKCVHILAWINPNSYQEWTFGQNLWEVSVEAFLEWNSFGSVFLQNTGLLAIKRYKNTMQNILCGTVMRSEFSSKVVTVQ